MGARKKYYKTKAQAKKALMLLPECVRRDEQLEIFRMPKGSRKAGWFAVCDLMTYLNTY
jgi:hypothetical protein